MKSISPFRIVILIATLSLLSLLLIPKLRVDLVPHTSGNTITVSFYLPNSSPDIVELQATSLLENALSRVTGIKNIRSASDYNQGQIWLSFAPGTDFNVREFEISAIIKQLFPKLPPGISYPVVSSAIESAETDSRPLLIYSIHAPQQPFKIKQTVEELLVKKLAGFSGLQNATLSGVNPLQVVIRYDIRKCQLLQLSPSQINYGLLSRYAVTYPGSIHTGTGEQYFLRIQAAQTSIREIAQTLLTTPRGPIHLGDIATVSIEEADPQWYLRINGQNALNMSVYIRKGGNAILMAGKLKTAINKLVKDLPAAYHVSMSYDNADFLEKEMNKNYQRAILSVSILSLFIFLSYRKWRYLLILISGLVVNLSLTLIFSYLFQVNIHLYTIAGIAIAFGIMTDNAIVMLDHYHRYLNRKIFPALLASSLTSMAALSLVFLLPMEQRENLSDFSIIIVLSLAASVIVAFLFIPALYQLLTDRNKVPVRVKFSTRKTWWKIRSGYGAGLSFLAKYKAIYLTLILLLFGLPVFLLPDKCESATWYANIYNNTIGSSHYQEHIKPTVNKWLGGFLRPFIENVYEKSGYQTPERTLLYVNASMPIGNTIDQMDRIISDFERQLGPIKGIDKFITRIYSGQHGSIEISFKEAVENTRFPAQLKQYLISRSIDWGGVKWTIHGVGRGFTNNGSDEIPAFVIKMKGYNFDNLEQQAIRLGQILSRHKRVQKININERQSYDEQTSQEYVLNLNPEKMKLRNTDQYEIINALRDLSKPVNTASSIIMNNTYYQVLIKEKNSDNYSNYNIMHNALQLDTNRAVQIKDVGNFEFRNTMTTVNKENRQYIRHVSFEYLGAPEFGEKYLSEALEEMKKTMPVGYTAEKPEWTNDWGHSGRHYYLILFLMVLIFFICSVLFESLRQPLFIILVIPLSFIGLFISFSSGNTYFDQGGYAAFIMLGGLVANASIFIINDYNQLRTSSHQHNNRLLVRAIFYRSKTILLTIISCCCGLLPFLAEGQHEIFWYAFAIGTSGGLLFSLLVIFFVFPVFLYRRTNNS